LKSYINTFAPGGGGWPLSGQAQLTDAFDVDIIGNNLGSGINFGSLNAGEELQRFTTNVKDVSGIGHFAVNTDNISLDLRDVDDTFVFSELYLSQDGINISTNDNSRLEISQDGEWFIEGSEGSAGQVLTSNGTGLSPTWEDGGGGSDFWSLSRQLNKITDHVWYYHENTGFGINIGSNQTADSLTSDVAISSEFSAAMRSGFDSDDLGVVEVKPNEGFLRVSRDAGTEIGEVYVNENGIALNYTGSSSVSSISVLETGTTISSSAPGFIGATYGADYSANFSSNSLVNKQWVEELVTGSSGWATSGTTALTTDVTIDGEADNTTELSLGGDSGNELLAFNVHTSGARLRVASNQFTFGPVGCSWCFSASGSNFSWAGASTGSLSLLANAVGGGSATLGAAGAGQFDFGTSQQIFTDNSSTKEGIEYAADYSANFSNRSLIDLGTANARYFSGNGGTFTMTNDLFLTTSTSDFIGVGLAAPTSSFDMSASVASGAITTVTGNTTLNTTHHTVLVDATSGNITITLPSVSSITRREYIIKKIDASTNTVTVDANSTQVIDGALTQVLRTQWQGIQIKNTGTSGAWYILSDKASDGTYTPTLTNTSNIDSSTPSIFQYSRVGNVVTVSGMITIDPTATTTAVLQFTLPIASNIGGVAEVAGNGIPVSFSPAGYILGDVATDRAVLTFPAAGTVADDFIVHFTYKIN
jgi:hypothetical protein